MKQAASRTRRRGVERQGSQRSMTSDASPRPGSSPRNRANRNRDEFKRAHSGFTDDTDEGDEERRPSIFHQFIDGIFYNNPKFWESTAYLAFVAIFCMVAVSANGGANNPDAYTFVQQMKKIFGNFEEIQNIEEWWDFVENDLITGVFPKQWYNSEQISLKDRRFINLEYLLLGAVGLRQLRVTNSSCDVLTPLVNISQDCYGEFSTRNENRTAFGDIIPGTNNQRPYKYKTAKDLGCTLGCSSSGDTGVSYPAGGFVYALPTTDDLTTVDVAASAIAKLKNDLWIDRSTRMVAIDFTAYSIATDLAASTTLMLELPASGGVVANIDVSVMRIGHLYAQYMSITILVAEGVMLLMILVFTGIELSTWRKMGTSNYFMEMWHWFDWINFILFYVAFGLRYAAFINAGSIKFPPSDDQFAYYRGAGDFVYLWKNVMGLNSFFTWFKIFKYFSHIPFMARLVKVMAAAAEDCIAFLICFFVVYFGFVLAFFLSYGNVLEDYSSIPLACYTLFRMMLGDFDFDPLRKENKLLGPLYFVMYTLLSTLLLLNMFVAIVMEGYDEVRSNEEKVTILQFVKKAFGIKAQMEDDEEAGDDVQGFEQPQGPNKVHPATNGDAGFNSLGAAANVGWMEDDKAANQKLVVDNRELIAAMLEMRSEMKNEIMKLSNRVKNLTDTRSGGAPKKIPGFIE